MGLFFGKGKTAPGRPSGDWPWTLNVSGALRPDSGTWEMIVSELRKLNPEDPDSFLILEQRDPRNSQNYWFIQSAVNRAGPRPGWYTVEVGWGSQRGTGLRDLDVQTVEEVIPFFQAAYNRKAVDLSGFTDMSGLLG
jgi:hypothetical protein